MELESFWPVVPTFEHQTSTSSLFKLLADPVTILLMKSGKIQEVNNIVMSLLN